MDEMLTTGPLSLSAELTLRDSVFQGDYYSAILPLSVVPSPDATLSALTARVTGLRGELPNVDFRRRASDRMAAVERAARSDSKIANLIAAEREVVELDLCPGVRRARRDHRDGHAH